MKRVAEYGIFDQEVSRVVGSREAALGRLKAMHPPENGWVALNAQFFMIDDGSIVMHVFLQRWEVEE